MATTILKITMSIIHSVTNDSESESIQFSLSRADKLVTTLPRSACGYVAVYIRAHCESVFVSSQHHQNQCSHSF